MTSPEILAILLLAALWLISSTAAFISITDGIYWYRLPPTASDYQYRPCKTKGFTIAFLVGIVCCFGSTYGLSELLDIGLRIIYFILSALLIAAVIIGLLPEKKKQTA
jgi:hypothetical protein